MGKGLLPCIQDEPVKKEKALDEWVMPASAGEKFFLFWFFADSLNSRSYHLLVL